MISLKIEKQQQSAPVAPEQSEYGYGSQLYLEPSQVEALGLAQVDAGKRVYVEAKGFVKHVQIAKEDGKIETRVCIQLTDAHVAVASEDSETARALYGGGGAPDGADQSQSGMGA